MILYTLIERYYVTHNLTFKLCTVQNIKLTYPKFLFVNVYQTFEKNPQFKR